MIYSLPITSSFLFLNDMNWINEYLIYSFTYKGKHVFFCLFFLQYLGRVRASFGLANGQASSFFYLKSVHEVLVVARTDWVTFNSLQTSLFRCSWGFQKPTFIWNNMFSVRPKSSQFPMSSMSNQILLLVKNKYPNIINDWISMYSSVVLTRLWKGVLIVTENWQ